MESENQNIAPDAPHPNRSTGPREGKARCSLNAYRHGLTGQLNILTPGERQAYDQHSKITLEALAPVGAYEQSLAQSIADDNWRLKRARTIESGLFAMAMQYSDDNTGAPQVDDAFAQAEGKPYQPEACFKTAPAVRESVFSTAEVARELDRAALMSNAISCSGPSILRKRQEAKVAQASACEPV